MKKIYTLASGLILCGSMLGQSAFNMMDNSKQPAVKPANAKPPISYSTGADRTTSFNIWVEPVGAVMTAFGIDLTGATTGTSQGNFLNVVYQDSTVTASDPVNGTKFVGTTELGSVLDPTSPNLQTSFIPICTATDAYSIDSLVIQGSYVKKTAAVDTLYTYLVWGDSSNAAVFSKRLNTLWGVPENNFRHSIIGATVTGAIAGPGNVIRAGAPAANKMLIKYVLTNADSVVSGGFSKYITIALPSVVNIPAGSLVSCFYTFVPASGSHVMGDCSYSFTGAPATQNVNGFAGIVWGQTSPTVTTFADYTNQQVDPNGWNMGTTYLSGQRHIFYPASLDNSNIGDLTTAPLIFYHIFNTPAGINEISDNFSLGQNTPNPFTNQTKINYQLKTSAKSVSLEIYDVAGVKMFEKIQSNLSSGSYSVDVNDTKFSSGIYFYSLIVDGSKVTKKMVVTK